MNDHAVMTIIGIGSVATAMAGFSGVVAAFGGRAAGRWLPAERFRTKNMLILSLGACLLSFIPLALELFRVSEQALWVSASFCVLAFCAWYLSYTMVKIRNPNLRHPGGLVMWVRDVFYVCLSLAIILQALNVAGIGFERGPGPFVGGLMLMLVSAGLQFAFLVLAPLASAES